MTSSKHRREQLMPGLLPFMAVLLCTMGALVLILILMVSNAQASAKKKVEEQKVEIEETVEDISFVAKELIARRTKQQEETDQQRRHLAHYEDHVKRLEEELQVLEQSLRQLDPKDAADTRKIDPKQRIESLKQEIEKATREKEERLKKGEIKPAFAILPYRGPNGTTRRPIYLECTAEGVRIQPEGVLIPLSSLRPPLGPGNPLDASLRLIRSEYERISESTSTLASPYPLLLVRPDGIRTYSVARAAMGGWDDQFGYELVDGSMPLAFPPKTPGLVDVLQKTIATATQRQEALASAMPSRYGDMGSRSEIRPEASYQEDVEDVEHEEGDVVVRIIPQGEKWEVIQELPSSARLRAEPNTSAINQSTGAGSTGAGSKPNGFANSTGGTTPTERDGSKIAMGLGGFAGPREISGGEWALGNSDSNTNGSSRVGNVGGGEFGSGAPNGADASGANASEATGGASGQSGKSGTGGSTKPGSTMQPIFLQSETENSMTNDPSNPNNPTNIALGQQGPSPSTSTGDDRGANTNRDSRTTSKPRNAGDKPISSASSRSWSRNRALTKSVPVVREIHMVVLADRWLIRSENNPAQVETTILLENGPSAASSQLSRAVKDRIASWGVAVSGGFWKPMLIAETYSDAEVSLLRLEKLLEGSGLEISVKRSDANRRR